MDFGGKMPLFCPLQECSILKLQSVSLSLHLHFTCSLVCTRWGALLN